MPVEVSGFPATVWRKTPIQFDVGFLRNFLIEILTMSRDWLIAVAIMGSVFWATIGVDDMWTSIVLVLGIMTLVVLMVVVRSRRNQTRESEG